MLISGFIVLVSVFTLAVEGSCLQYGGVRGASNLTSAQDDMNLLVIPVAVIFGCQSPAAKGIIDGLAKGGNGSTKSRHSKIQRDIACKLQAIAVSSNLKIAPDKLADIFIKKVDPYSIISRIISYKHSRGLDSKSIPGYMGRKSSADFANYYCTSPKALYEAYCTIEDKLISLLMSEEFLKEVGIKGDYGVYKQQAIQLKYALKDLKEAVLKEADDGEAIFGRPSSEEESLTDVDVSAEIAFRGAIQRYFKELPAELKSTVVGFVGDKVKFAAEKIDESIKNVTPAVAA